MAELTHEQLQKIKRFQKNEITEYYIYKNIARITKNEENRSILENIAEDELKHYTFWVEQTGVEVKPNRWKIFSFFWIARIFGLTFGIKLMEKGEEQAQISYHEFASVIPESKRVLEDEDAHED
jgi:demethoxyubiquinone hydroxylase (CLK1/Coq7/Cat5 family)